MDSQLCRDSSNGKPRQSHHFSWISSRTRYLHGRTHTGCNDHSNGFLHLKGSDDGCSRVAERSSLQYWRNKVGGGSHGSLELCTFGNFWSSNIGAGKSCG